MNRQGIEWKYPDLEYLKDYRVINEGTEREIFEWNTIKYPKPTNEQTQQWYNGFKYQTDRKTGTIEKPIKYASDGDQKDMQYWDAINGTTTWVEHINEVKEAHKKLE